MRSTGPLREIFPISLSEAFGPTPNQLILPADTESKGKIGMAEGTFAADRLRSFIERIERLEQEKQDLAADIREVYSEAKGVGFDPKVMRQVVRLRKMDDNDRRELEMVIDTYLHALGMTATPAAAE
jgi:uncharacterized protein (UPF0335 family)